MAFALTLQSVHDLPDGHGQTIFTATTAIVVLTASDGVLSLTIFKCNMILSTVVFTVLSCKVSGITDWRLNWHHA